MSKRRRNSRIRRLGETGPNSETEKASELMGDLQSWWEKTNAPIPSELNPDFEL